MTKSNKRTFIAIGVGQGDAFFLQKGGLTALVDGGRSAQGFPYQFQRVTKRNGIDILVCTHNDADHAAGVLGFLQSGLSCKEVWLPGSWTGRLDDLLRNPARFTSELISNISERELNVEGNLKLESFGDQIDGREIERAPVNLEGGSLDRISEALELASEDLSHHESNSWQYLHNALFYDWRYFDHPLQQLGLGGPNAFQLFLEAVSAASMIRNIALAAYHSGTMIRWFEYDQTRSGGGLPDFLVPINSCEIARIQRPRYAFDYLALTTSNRESLVHVRRTERGLPLIRPNPRAIIV